MHSYLIISTDQEQNLKKINNILNIYSIDFPEINIEENQNNPDLFLLNPQNSIGIDNVRKIQSFLSKKPYQHSVQIVVILQGEKMTREAQNAFLKTLEEIPDNKYIFISASHKNNFLSTITSRCQIVNLAQDKETIIDTKTKKERLEKLRSLIKSGAGERINKIEPQIKSREKAVQFCKESILALRQVAIKDNKANKKEVLRIIKLLRKTKYLLEKNVNVKLAMENMVLEL